MYIKALTFNANNGHYLNNDNVSNVNDGINANNVININSIQFTFFECKHNISYAISLRRYYIEQCIRDTVVPAEQFPLYCKITNNLSTQIQECVPYNAKYGTASMAKHCFCGAAPTSLS